MSIARATRILPQRSIIALAAMKRNRSPPFLAAHERKLPRAPMDTHSYTVATVSTRRARLVGNGQKMLSVVDSEELGIIARHADGRKSRSSARTKHAKEYEL